VRKDDEHRQMCAGFQGFLSPELSSGQMKILHKIWVALVAKGGRWGKSELPGFLQEELDVVSDLLETV
jgi:hypothetical protein